MNIKDITINNWKMMQARARYMEALDMLQGRYRSEMNVHIIIIISVLVISGIFYYFGFSYVCLASIVALLYNGIMLVRANSEVDNIEAMLGTVDQISSADTLTDMTQIVLMKIELKDSK